jgi:ppGpp synthetase/RelA/SpoT-type nucleotidyltranferase
MKIPQSIRNCYQEIRPGYDKLKELADAKILGRKSRKWHYESRIKELESFALKLETGREAHPRRSEDMFGCMLVVENHSKIPEAAEFVSKLFKEESRRPPEAKKTSLNSHSFAFEDLRIYAAWVDDDTLPPTIANGLLFELQIKTFLQHAWGIATHDLIYKTDEADWGSSRVAYQVKAMLENAELSISEAKRLTSCALLDRTDTLTTTLAGIIKDLKSRWTESGTLPDNIRGLANNILDLSRTLKIELEEIWKILDAATAAGRGAKLLDLSPYGSIIEALVADAHGALFNPLTNPRNRYHVFVPVEIDLPPLPNGAAPWVVRA